MSTTSVTAARGIRNASRRLDLGGERVTAEMVSDVRDLHLEGPAVVVNTGMTDALAGEAPRKPIPPLNSSLLSGTQVARADTLVVLRTAAGDGSAGEITGEPGWSLLGDLLGDGAGVTGGLPFDRSTPLWKGPQETLGRVRFDPAHLLRESPEPAREDLFEVRVNLWFAPAGTDCFIHNRHDFIEVHTQVLGHGRMQKFREQDHRTLYEDVPMSPGYTTPDPFCATRPDGSFHYPWHQYRADTDCVWLAVEYHRVTPLTDDR